LGVGAKVPDDDLDMFGLKRKSNTSNDKLLEQLLGKKAAKGHQASKSRAQKEGTQSGSKVAADGRGKPEPVPSDDDEEEGRASMIKSKSGKKRKRPLESEVLEVSSADNMERDDATEGNANGRQDARGAEQKDAESSDRDAPAPSRRKSKSARTGGSYLDQLLEEKARKKKKKSS